MLDAPMKEGEALASKSDDTPIEIILPADKEIPMWQLLYTLYGSDPRAKTFSISEVKEIAILAEKYNMVERLEVFGSFWLLTAGKLRLSEINENGWNCLIVA
ncbi:hypothetical protein FBEOM_2146 [Fusarium beomiforme]|uniref:BTB domain-containing protein n=1 Tax=Fusarium beomiforme TaxID=44412 RepID=A0A9P5AS18_9HYPO|nr:hypothetical protein FBEOM_2146 [Fusarium beomiforme]